MIYYARSAKDGCPAQEYTAHVNGVRSLVHKYLLELEPYSVRDKTLLSRTLEMASVYHDMGKLNKDNQAVLSGREVSKSLPHHHADAGAAYFLDDRHFSATTAAVIQAHHIGFLDFSEERNKGRDAFRDLEVMSEVNLELPRLEAIHDSLIHTAFEYGVEDISGDQSVFLRMLLSCLADADHTDAALHYKRYPVGMESIPLRPAERLMHLDRYVNGLNGINNERDTLRREMYCACRNASIDSDIASCDSPVGSGKTTSVMAHLLAQAAKRGLRRIIVVLPFTNIIRQSVDKYRQSLVLPGENPQQVVAEIHHRADFETEDVRYLTALWRAPIIITTAVAFFETLASDSTSTLRRLHELPGSAIFVDEYHASVPAKLLPLVWRWINIYAKEWSCYWVLASGSLNRFWTIPEIAGSNNDESIPELVNEKLRTRLSSYEKDRISYHSDLNPKDTAELAEWIVSVPGPRLVILNTVQSAAVLADYFAERFGKNHVEHLSTALTPEDRENTLYCVKRRLTSGDKDWTLIATSCIEAGVDLSFKNGFRELGSLVSLLQAAGRVNREGVYTDSKMWSFCLAEGRLLRINPSLKESAAVLRQYFLRDEIIIPELSTQSIRDEIAMYGLSGVHKKLVVNEQLQNFKWVEREFKVIETDTRLVVVSESVAERLQHGRIDWQLLQRVSVQIAKYKLQELKTPVVMDNIYLWNLEYNNFLGYMAGILKLKKLEGEVMIV